jgi:hypothetical protein
MAQGYPTKGMWPAEKRAERGSGYVYLIRPVLGKKSKWFKDKELCPVKIGVSRDKKKGVDSRLKSLGSGNWNKLCIEMISPKLSEPFNVEYYLHRVLNRKRIRGEWFELSLSEIKELKEKLRKEPEIERDDNGDLIPDSLTEGAYQYDKIDAVWFGWEKGNY